MFKLFSVRSGRRKLVFALYRGRSAPLLLIGHDQELRQNHFRGDQNRAEDRYEEEAYGRNEEGQHNLNSRQWTPYLQLDFDFLL